MFVGRYVLRNWVSRQTKRFKIFGAIDKAIETEVKSLQITRVGVQADVPVEALPSDPLQSVQLPDGDH